VLPGQLPDGEVWLTAHLCHPRPGANDNASGVATLLGIAAAHAASRRADASWAAERTIRFFWGPEFLGIAAALHSRARTPGGDGLPSAVLNFDMVGEDQSRCGGPFVVERNPDCLLALISPIAEHIVSEVFSRTKDHGGTWRAAPFYGSSDHALFADPNIACPAVQFCHPSDRFNHTAGDSLDKVSAIEMLRATSAGAALTYVLACDGALPHHRKGQLLRDWCADEYADALRVASRHGNIEDGAWGRQLVEYTARRNAAMCRLLDGDPVSPRESLLGRPAAGPDPVAIRGRWAGPINVRAMIADLPTASRSAVSRLIKANKDNYALLLNFAIRADGRRSRDDIIRETSYALRCPPDDTTARLLFDALLESGWVERVP
jgi:Peptidase family M28